MKKNRMKVRYPGWLTKMVRGDIGITIGRPIKDQAKHLNTYAMYNLFNRLRAEGYTVDDNDLFNPRGGSIISMQRNRIVEEFMKRDGKNQPLHQYLLFIDDDQCFPPGYDPYDAFKMLRDADKDIVGAMTAKKFWPHHVNISIWCDKGYMTNISYWPEDELFRVHQLGFGMVLIKRQVILDIMHMTDPPKKVFYDTTEFSPIINAVEYRGEDYHFCIDAIKLGYDIWVEPRIPLMHIAETMFGAQDYKICREKLPEDDRGVDICQHTDLYAKLADALRKSYAPYRKGINLSDAASVAVRRKESLMLPISDSSNGTRESVEQT